MEGFRLRCYEWLYLNVQQPGQSGTRRHDRRLRIDFCRSRQTLASWRVSVTTPFHISIGVREASDFGQETEVNLCNVSESSAKII